MRVWRKMIGTNWIEQKTNETVLNEVNEKNIYKHNNNEKKNKDNWTSAKTQ